MHFSQVGPSGPSDMAHSTLVQKKQKDKKHLCFLLFEKKGNTFVLFTRFIHIVPEFTISNDKMYFILEYGVDRAKAKSISLEVLNRNTCHVMKEAKRVVVKEGEKTPVKDVKMVVKEEEMAVLKEVGRMEQMPEVKKSAGGLYPDLSLLTDA